MTTKLKLTPNPTFVSMVKIPVPGDAAQEVEFTFVHKSAKDIKAFYADMANNDFSAISKIIVGWNGVDSDFSEDALSIFLDNYPRASAAIFSTYNRELLGVAEKN